ncbi:uncharacterized protein [Haliotis cracherodii]|uniref:uncharacterized protein n=1 Tax=Haliotis cracherodii TaxID=6455 RepID=UPI0039E82C1A
MEEHRRVSMFFQNSSESWISLKTNKYSRPVLRVHIKCGKDISHVMLAVNNRQGSLKHLFFLKAGNDMERSVPDLDTVQVFGLKIDTGQSSDRYPFATSYTVETTRKLVISPTYQTQELDLSCGFSSLGHVMHLLGETQDRLEMEVEHKPPLDYSLKPTGPSDSEAGLCVVFCERSQKEYVVMSSALVSASIPLLPVSKSRTNYKVKVVGLKGSSVDPTGQRSAVCQDYTPTGGSDTITVKTCNTKADLQHLLDKAKTFCSKNLQTPGRYNVTKFYRNKPESYYDNIMSNRAGVMEKYLKDNNGDPYCPINNKINGLFFSGSKNKKKIPYFSFFGNRRLFIPVEELFTSDTRMYFSDFYCHKDTHYVTVVVTKMGSAEDRFCEERLIEQDLQANPFFTVREDTTLTSQFVSCSRNLEDILRGYSGRSMSSQKDVPKTFTMVSVNKFHVEFLYTEDIDIRGLQSRCGEDKVYFKYVRAMGRGRSKKEGIPKKLDCPDCSFDP